MKIGGCEFPDSFLYDVDSGTWGRREEHLYTIGVAPQLNWVSGGFTSVSFKQPGTRVAIGKSVGSVEGPRHFDVVRAPFDCVISSVNGEVFSEPRLINRDPYGRGWFAILEFLGGPSKMKPLGEVSQSLKARLKELGLRCFAEFPDREMFEIGVECSAVLVRLNDLLGASPSGTIVHIVSDDPTSDVEMARWELQTRNRVLESIREGSLFHFIVKKSPISQSGT
ncbi:MAG: hypothetical protein LYZ69_00225 [Nitrososphaerales archaeon]|nr:hypothetical protein [Nitrososphaerales archaeon]